MPSGSPSGIRRAARAGREGSARRGWLVRPRPGRAPVWTAASLLRRIVARLGNRLISQGSQAGALPTLYAGPVTRASLPALSGNPWRTGLISNVLNPKIALCGYTSQAARNLAVCPVT
jgi:hypothetical protein